MSDVLDRIVVQVVADVDNAQRKMKSYGDTTEAALNKVNVATNKAGQAATSAGAQIAQAAEQASIKQRLLGVAMTEVSGASAALAGILTGGLAAAIIGAGSLIGTLIGKMLEEGVTIDSIVQKLKENEQQTTLLDAAKEKFSHTLEGVTNALYDQKKALDAVDAAEKTSAANANIAAQNELQRIERIRATTVALLAQAEAEYQSAQGQTFGAAGGAGAGIATSIYAGRLDEVRKLKAAADAAYATAVSGLDRSRVDLAQEEGKRRASPQASLNKQFDDEVVAAGRKADAAIAAARKLGKNTTDLTNALAATVAAIEARRTASLQALQDAKKAPPKVDYGSGREINEAEARRIVGSIGGRVTNGVRSAETQKRLYADLQAGRRTDPVAKPGTSAHERGQAIDVAFGPGITIASIKEAFAKEGVKLRKIFVEPGQGVFHVDFGGGRGAGRPKVDNTARDAERKREEGLRNQKQFEAERDQLNQELLRSLASQTLDAATLAQLAVDQVNSESAAKLQRIDADEQLGKLTKAQADELRAIAGQVGHQQVANIAAAMQERLAKEKLELTQADLANQGDVLDAQLDLADTSRQRHGIEQKLLELKYEEVRLQQEANLAAAIRNKDANGEKIARDRLALLPTLQGLDQQRLDRKYESPGKRLVRDLNSQAGDLGNAFEDVAVSGLQSLNSELSDAIANSKSLGDAFHHVAAQIVADLLRIAIQQAVIKPLASALFGGGGDHGGGGLGSVLASILGSAAHSHGASSGFSSLVAQAPGFAAGGSMLLGGRGGVDQNLLSLNGRPLARVSAGETLNVSPRARAASGGGVMVIAPQLYDLSGVVMTEDLVEALRHDNRRYANAVGEASARAAVRASPGANARLRRFGG